MPRFDETLSVIRSVQEGLCIYTKSVKLLSLWEESDDEYFQTILRVCIDAYVWPINQKSMFFSIPRSYVEFFSSIYSLVTIYILKPYGSLIPFFVFFKMHINETLGAAKLDWEQFEYVVPKSEGLHRDELQAVNAFQMCC